jgi:hypothetical protein
MKYSNSSMVNTLHFHTVQYMFWYIETLTSLWWHYKQRTCQYVGWLQERIPLGHLAEGLYHPSLQTYERTVSFLHLLHRSETQINLKVTNIKLATKTFWCRIKFTVITSPMKKPVTPQGCNGSKNCEFVILTSCRRVYLEQLRLIQLVKKFHAFYGTQRFIALVIQDYKWSLF